MTLDNITTRRTRTRRVLGRRHVRYESLLELLADAELQTESQPRMLGNWSEGQIYQHLALSVHAMIDGAPLSIPPPAQWLIRTFLKRWLLSRPLPAGFKLTGRARQLLPDETTAAAGLSGLREAIVRLENTSVLAPHPALGVCSRAESIAFQCRHAELHMSFMVNDDTLQG